MSKRYVMVTTDKRGVFAGYLEAETQKTVTLSEARMCVYWSQETKGVLGLAACGPQQGSRITDAVPSIKLTGITSITDVTDEARAKWEAAPWS